MIVYNTTHLSGRAREVSAYGVLIPAYGSRDIDTSWVCSYPSVLQTMIQKGEVSTTCPKENGMPKLLNTTKVPVVVGSPEFSNTQLEPGIPCGVSDEMLNKLSLNTLPEGVIILEDDVPKEKNWGTLVSKTKLAEKAGSSVTEDDQDKDEDPDKDPEEDSADLEKESEEEPSVDEEDTQPTPPATTPKKKGKK